MRLHRILNNEDVQSQKTAQGASNLVGNQPSKKEVREALRAVQNLAPSMELLQPPSHVDTSPDLLVAAGNILDPELRQLFQEVQQFCAHKRIGHDPDPARLAAAYKRASQRLEHLPAAPVETAGGGILMAPLPGPRGVLGYDFDTTGRVRESAARRMGRYLAMSPHAHRILRQMAELEKVRPKVAAGLEDDPELVRLWRRLGGPRHRHHNLHASNRQADEAAPLEVLKNSKPVASSRAQASKSSTLRSPSQPLPARTHVSLIHPQERKSSKSANLEKARLLQMFLPPSPNQMDSNMGQAYNMVSFGNQEDGRSSRSSRGSREDGSNTNFPSVFARGPSPMKPSLKQGIQSLLFKRKTDAEIKAEIAQLVEDLYRPLTTVAGQATNELGDVIDERTHGPGSATGSEGSFFFEPSDGEPDPSFSALLPKSPDASSDSYDSEEPTPSSSRCSSRGPSTTRSIRGSRAGQSRDCYSSSEEFTAESLLGTEPCRKRRSSGFGSNLPQGHAISDTAAPLVLPLNKFRMERRRSCGRRTFGTSTQRSSRKSVALDSELDFETFMVDEGQTHKPVVPPPEEELHRQSTNAFHFTSGGGPDDADSALEILADTILSLRRRQQVLHKVSSQSISRANSRHISRSGSCIQTPQELEKLSPQEALKEATEGIKQLMSRRSSSIEPLAPWLEDGLSEEAFQLVTSFAEKWTMDNDTAGMQGLAARLKRLLLEGPTPVKEEAQGITLAAVARRIMQAQSINSPLLDLALGTHKLSRADIEVITSALQQAYAQGGLPMTALRAGDGVLGAEGVTGLVQILLKECLQLQDLDLSHCNYFGAWAADKLGALLGPEIGLNLKHLNLSGCPLQDAGCKGLCKGLEQNKHLTHLWLPKCDLTDASLGWLGRVVAKDTPLILLDVSENVFTGSGMHDFATGMEANSRMQELFFRACYLCDDAASALATIITQAPNLLLLDASSNHLSTAGASILAAGLERLEPTEASMLAAATRAANQEHLSRHPSAHRASTASYQARSRLPAAAGSNERRGSEMKSEAGGPLDGDPFGTQDSAGRQRVQAYLREVHASTKAHSSFHTLVLSHNPLGCDGVTLLFKALTQLQGPRLAGCNLTVLRLDGVACASSTHLTRQQERVHLPGPVHPPSSAAKAMQLKMWDADQQQEEREQQELKQRASQQQEKKEEAGRMKQQQQQQSLELLHHQARQRLQQDLAEQNLPPMLREEMEQEHMLLARQQEDDLGEAPSMPPSPSKQTAPPSPSKQPTPPPPSDLQQKKRQQQQQQQQQRPESQQGVLRVPDNSGGKQGGEQGSKKRVKKASGDGTEKVPRLPEPPPLYFDPKLPNGVHYLDLAVEQHRKVAHQMVDLYKQTDGLAWIDAWLDDMHIPAAPRGPPKEGAPAPALPAAEQPKPTNPAEAMAQAKVKKAQQLLEQVNEVRPDRGAKQGPLWPDGCMPDKGLLKVHVMQIASVDPDMLLVGLEGPERLPSSRLEGDSGSATTGLEQQTRQSTTGAVISAYTSPSPDEKRASTAGSAAVCGLRESDLPVMSDVLESCVLHALQSPLADDIWRLAVIERVTNVACVSSERAARLLSCFAYSGQQVEAALLLLSVCSDVYALLPTLLNTPPLPLEYSKQSMAIGPQSDHTGFNVGSHIDAHLPASETGVMGPGKPSAASYHLHLHQQQRTPVMAIPTAAAFVHRVAKQALQLSPGCLPPGSESLSLSNGTYTLNLGLQSHMFLACTLVSVAALQGPRPMLLPSMLPWSACSPASPWGPRRCPEAAAWAVLGIHDAGACIRHLTYNGKPLMPHYKLGYIGSHGLPSQGTLQLDFLSPVTAAAATPLAAKRISGAENINRAPAQASKLFAQHLRPGRKQLSRVGIGEREPEVANKPASNLGRATSLRASKSGRRTEAGDMHPPQQRSQPSDQHRHLGPQEQEGEGAHPRGGGRGPLGLVAQQQHREVQDHLGHMASLWEHLHMSHANLDAICNISREVERGQHLGYEGWMGSKEDEAPRPHSSAKSLRSAYASRGASISGAGRSQELDMLDTSNAAEGINTSEGVGGGSGNDGSEANTGPLSTPGRKSNLGLDLGGLYGSHRKPSLGSSALKGRPLAFVQFRVAAGAAWAACFARCVTHLGLEGDVGLNNTKREASRLWSETSYESHSINIQLDGEFRRAQRVKANHQKQEEAQQKAQAAAGVETEPEARGGKDGKKGQQKEKGGKGSAKKSGKGNKQGKASKNQAAAAAHAKAIETLLDQECRRATACLETIAAHAAAFPVTTFQAAAFLQVLPDVTLRLAALKLLLPALVDPTHTLDLVVCLDAPALLPTLPSPPEPKAKSKAKPEEPRPTLALTRDFGGDSFKVLMGSTPSSPLGPGRRALLTKTEPRNLNLLLNPTGDHAAFQAAAKQSTIANPSAFTLGSFDQGLIGVANTIASPTSVAPLNPIVKVHCTEASPSSPLSPEDAFNSEHYAHVLLLVLLHATAAHIGWQWLKVPILSMDEMQGDLVVVLDPVGEIEQLQTLSKLCRLADRCRNVPFTDGPGLLEAATDGGVLELEHDGTWSYWEQVLGWTCWRPWSPPNPPQAKPERPKPNAKPGEAPAPEKPKQKKQEGPVPPKLGRVALRFRLTLPHQEWAAAILIQSVWRGWAGRQLLMAKLRQKLMPDDRYRLDLEKAKRRVHDLSRAASLPQDKAKQDVLIKGAGQRMSSSGYSIPSPQDGDTGGESSDLKSSTLQQNMDRRPSMCRQLRRGSAELKMNLQRLSSMRRPSIGFPGAINEVEPLNPPMSPFQRSSYEALEDPERAGPFMARPSSTGSPNILQHQQHEAQIAFDDPHASDASLVGLPQGTPDAAGQGGLTSIDLSTLNKMASMHARKASRAASAARFSTTAALFSTIGQEHGDEESEGDEESTSRTSARCRQEAAMLARAEGAKANMTVAVSILGSRAKMAKVSPRVAAQWRYLWAAYKVHRREQRLQLLAKQMFVSFAHQEMQANADHLFPWPPADLNA